MEYFRKSKSIENEGIEISADNFANNIEQKKQEFENKISEEKIIFK